MGFVFFLGRLFRFTAKRCLCKLRLRFIETRICHRIETRTQTTQPKRLKGNRLTQTHTLTQERRKQQAAITINVVKPVAGIHTRLQKKTETEREGEKKTLNKLDKMIKWACEHDYWYINRMQHFHVPEVV